MLTCDRGEGITKKFVTTSYVHGPFVPRRHEREAKYAVQVGYDHIVGSACFDADLLMSLKKLYYLESE
jgi:CobQ-like glutamine amidotransferase family enzyme